MQGRTAMSIASKALIVTVATGLAHAALAQTVPATQAGTTTKIEPGLIIGSNNGQTINGWEDRGGGLYPQRSYERGAAVERNECCYSIFKKGDAYTVAISVAVGRNATGGVLAERVVATREIQTPVGYEETDCSLLWIDPALSFYNPKNDMAISYVIVDNEVHEIRYVDLDNNCYQGD
jgi:hypothetical protein